MATFRHGVYGGNFQVILPDPRSVAGEPSGEQGGSSFFVAPTFELWRLARASRFYYRGTAQDTSAPAPSAEPEIAAPWLVRRAFRSLGRNPYLRHSAQDESVVAPLDLPHRLVRIPFRPLGRNPYLFHQDFESAPAPPAEPDTSSPFMVRRPYLRLGRNPYLWHTPQDLDAPPSPAEADTWTPYLVRLDIRGRLKVVPSYLQATAQDFDAPLPPVTDSSYYYYVSRKRRR